MFCFSKPISIASSRLTNAARPSFRQSLRAPMCYSYNRQTSPPPTHPTIPSTWEEPRRRQIPPRKSQRFRKRSFISVPIVKPGTAQRCRFTGVSRNQGFGIWPLAYLRWGHGILPNPHELSQSIACGAAVKAWLHLPHTLFHICPFIIHPAQ